MISTIILSIWLAVPAIGFPVLLISLLLKRRTRRLTLLREIPGMLFVMFLWPLLVCFVLTEKYKERRDRLSEVSKMIDAHYRDKWYE